MTEPVRGAITSAPHPAAASARAKVTSSALAEPNAPRERALGAVYAFTSYLLWGFLPLYFLLLTPTDARELVAWRIAFSLVFCLVLVTATRGWPSFLAALRTRRVMLLSAAAGVLIYLNWQAFILGTLTDRIVEASLGYFITPLVTVLFGVLVFRERLRVTQWAALGLAVVAIGVIVFGYGNVPWIALVLAFSFGTYGFVKKKIGPSVGAINGLTLETMWVMPIAATLLIFVATSSGVTFGSYGAWHAVLLAGTGIVTAVPLLFFAAGARRCTLTVLGLLQFLTPILQFAVGVWIQGEPMPLERWIGFGLVWAALSLLTADTLLFARKSRRIQNLGTLT